MIPTDMRGNRQDLADWLRKHRDNLKLRHCGRYEFDGLPVHVFQAKEPTFHHPELRRKTQFLDFTIFPF